MNRKLPFIFSNNYFVKNKTFKEEKEKLFKKFQIIQNPIYFSDRKNDDEKEKIHSSNFYLLYNLHNFKKFLDPKTYTPNLNDNEDVLKSMLYNLYGKNLRNLRREKKPLFKTIFKEFHLHKSKSVNYKNISQESNKSIKTKLNFSINDLSPQLSKILNFANLQNEELIKIRNKIKNNIDNEEEKKPKKINKRKSNSLPHSLFESKTEKLIKKYIENKSKENNIFRKLKEKVKNLENKNKRFYNSYSKIKTKINFFNKNI